MSSSEAWLEALATPPRPDHPWDLKAPQFVSLPTWTHTRGPKVGKLCAAVGLKPDPEQQVALDAFFAYDPDGGPAPVYELGLISPRQALKTGWGKQAGLGCLFVTREPVVTWSAHEFGTAWQTFKDLVAIIENSPHLRALMPPPKRRGEIVGGIRSGHGDVAIQTKFGNEIRFKARTNTGARGLTGDKLFLDEAFALKDEHMGSVLPTLTAVPDPQLAYMSSAGLRTSEVLRGIRDRGRFGADPRLAYFEYAAKVRECEDPNCQHPRPGEPSWKPSCALDDEDGWAEAYPLLGRRRENGTGLTLDRMRTFRRSEPSTEWARERLGWWDDPTTASIFGPGNWEACKGEVPAGEVPTGFGLAVGYKLSGAAIAAAYGTRERPMVRIIENGPGTAWVIPRLHELREQYPTARIVMDAAGPSGLVARDVQQEDRVSPQQVRPELPRVVELLDGVAEFFKAVTERRLVHEGDPELDAAAAVAARRTVRDRWLWGRTQSEGDIAPLEAATLAAWTLADEPVVSAYANGAGVTTI